MPDRILVVDDEENWREQFRDILEIAGHNVDTVEDFDEAKRFLGKSKYDLILVDICLDELDFHPRCQLFFDLLQHRYPDLPVVATSGKQIHTSYMWELPKFKVVDFVAKDKLLVKDFQRRIKKALSKTKSPDLLALHDAYALLIGVGDYTHPRFTNLPTTVHDAQAIADILTAPDLCGYAATNTHVITGPDSTATNILAALKTLAESTNPESTVLVYFSGHGGRALENSDWRAYICPREADPDNLAHTAISGDEFSTLLTTIPARKLLVMLDACHAAGSAELKAADGTSVWKAGLPDDYYETLSQGSGRVVIASSKENQYSYIRPQGDLSLFTWHLREALNGKAAVRGDGLIHVLDVFHYINETVQADEPRQVPILKVKDLDLNFAIALARRGKKAAGPVSTMTDVTTIREQIVHDPIGGAKALSDHLTTRPEWGAKRNKVDLKRADLERIQHDLDIFGPNPSDQAARNRAVYFLLRICLELEQQER